MEIDETKIILVGLSNDHGYEQVLEKLQKIGAVFAVSVEELGKAINSVEFPEFKNISLKSYGDLLAQECCLQEEPDKPYDRFLNKPIGKQRRQKRLS